MLVLAMATLTVSALRAVALLTLAQMCGAGQCRTAQLTFGVRADPAAGALDVQRAPVPYGPGLRTQGVLESHRTPSHPVEDALDPLQIGKLP